MNKRIYASVFSSIMSICMFSNYISYNISASTENIENYNNINLENELFSDDEVIDGQYIVVTNDKISDWQRFLQTEKPKLLESLFRTYICTIILKC